MLLSRVSSALHRVLNPLGSGRRQELSKAPLSGTKLRPRTRRAEQKGVEFGPNPRVLLLSAGAISPLRTDHLKGTEDTFTELIASRNDAITEQRVALGRECPQTLPELRHAGLFGFPNARGILGVLPPESTELRRRNDVNREVVHQVLRHLLQTPLGGVGGALPQRTDDCPLDLAVESRFHPLLGRLEVLRPGAGAIGIAVLPPLPVIVRSQVELDRDNEKLNGVCGRVVGRVQKATKETAGA